MDELKQFVTGAMRRSRIPLPAAQVLLTVWIACSALGQTYTIQTFAGGALPNNVPGTSAGLSVWGVAADAAGNVFVASGLLNAVYRLDAVTGILTLVAGNGAHGFSGDGGPATGASLNFPYAIAVDTSGNLYIADSGNYRIREVSNGVITTVAGNGTFGSSGDKGPARNAQLGQPVGVAVDISGNLYIADAGNYSIRKVSNGVITTVAGTGSPGFSGDNGSATNASFYNPTGVAVDASGNLYIADSYNNRIRKVSRGVITTVAGNGNKGFSGDNGPAASASLNGATGVAVDASGDIYIADYGNNRVRKVSSGVITTVAGYGVAGFSGDGPATNASLSSPNGVAVDASGNVYIADTGNSRARKISNGAITTVAGDGAPRFSGDGGPATDATLYGPLGVVGASGNLYLADSGNNCIREVSNGAITTVAGNGSQGFSGDNGPATSASLWGPASVAVDTSGDLYVADTGNNCIRKISNGVITTVAGNGAQGFSGDGGPATGASLNGPYAIAVDASGNLYVADSGNNRIRNVSNGAITTVAGNGGSAFSGDDGPATVASLWGPAGVAVDTSGDLYVADTGNNCIRKISNGVITTVAGNGTLGYSGDNGPATAASLSGPSGVAVDTSGNLYVADTGNNRVRILIPSAPACSFSVNPTSLSAPLSGGSLSVTISTTASCAWTVQNLPSWVTSSSAAGTGTAVITLTAAQNSGAARSAVISIAGVSVTVTQQGAVSTPGPTIATGSPLIPGAVGISYSETLSASGGTPSYTWSTTSGTLPPGLSLSSVGGITGVPSSAGTYSFTARVADNSSLTTTKAFTLPIIAAPTLTRSGVLAHIAAGGTWTTTVYLANTSANPVAFTLALHADDGSALNLPMSVTQQGSTQSVTAASLSGVIGANATLEVNTGSQVAATVTGWMDVLGSAPLSGYAIFQTASNGTASDGTASLQTQFESKIDVPYDDTAGNTTGVAIANLSTTSAAISVTIWDSSGTQLSAQSIMLPANGHTSFLFPTQFPVTAGQQGIVQFQNAAGGSLAGVGLQASPLGTFTSVPIILP